MRNTQSEGCFVAVSEENASGEYQTNAQRQQGPHENWSAQPVRYQVLAEYRCEVTASAVHFAPVESTSGPLSLHHLTPSPTILPPLDILPQPRSQATHG
ncbi:hypothetical protein EVAR_10484_1 [Eumeta japonica]|uniref:Uncharacterized protein n=1 Tax=Eumeta variegata TaxID=151549 RepID=A0A4C1TIA6_EUMVA|nr:hypothetical protein EVAR_10484_1 [Eumeta japonica]